MSRKTPKEPKLDQVLFGLAELRVVRLANSLLRVRGLKLVTIPHHEMPWMYWLRCIETPKPRRTLVRVKKRAR